MQEAERERENCVCEPAQRKNEIEISISYSVSVCLHQEPPTLREGGAGRKYGIMKKFGWSASASGRKSYVDQLWKLPCLYSRYWIL